MTDETPPPLTPPPTVAEPTIPFSAIYNLLSNFHQNNGTLNLPISHPATLQILDLLTIHNIDTLASRRWDDNYTKLRVVKSRYGDVESIKDTFADCDIRDLKEWCGVMRGCCREYEMQKKKDSSASNDSGQMLPRRHTIITTERYLKLKNVGLTFNRWEKRLLELRQFKEEMGHCDVPIDYAGVS